MRFRIKTDAASEDAQVWLSSEFGYELNEVALLECLGGGQ